MTMVDNMMGERIDTETAPDSALQEALKDIGKYYPADGRAKCTEGPGYFDSMREAVKEIQEELAWREEDAERSISW